MPTVRLNPNNETKKRFSVALSAYSIRDVIKMAAKKDVSKFRLIVKKGDNYGSVAGDYSLAETTVNGKSIWVSESISRMTFYAGQSWVITSTAYMKDVLGGATGGFVSSNDANVPYEADWGPNFDVSEVYLTVEKKFVPATEVYGSPSVHIWWSAPKHPEVQQQGVTWFYNRVEVTVPAESTYFMTNGFTGGYMGIQDRSPKWVLFSVWNNPKVPDGAVKELAHGEGVTVRPFGGEGKGGERSIIAYKEVFLLLDLVPNVIYVIYIFLAYSHYVSPSL